MTVFSAARRIRISSTGAILDSWNFMQNGERKWCWSRTSSRGSMLEQGNMWFTTRSDCVTDATDHGYLPDDTAQPQP